MGVENRSNLITKFYNNYFAYYSVNDMKKWGSSNILILNTSITVT